MTRVVVPMVQAIYAAGGEPFPPEQAAASVRRRQDELRPYAALAIELVTPSLGTLLNCQGQLHPPTWRVADLVGY